MNQARREHIESHETQPSTPAWVSGEPGESIEDAAFLAGAALASLHLVLGQSDTPRALISARLALRAAEASVAHVGRPERAADLRDAVAFLQPGDSPGPAGEIFLAWRRVVERPVSAASLSRALPSLGTDRVAEWFGEGQGAPVERAASVLEAVMGERPRDPAAALILADAALARALGWESVTPLLGVGLKRRDLGKTGAALRAACHAALRAASVAALREARALEARAERLRRVAPTLRAKGAEAAVALFLRQDAVAPTALTSLRSPRSARRFCDRLVALGAVRELTGRDTFRLYGL